MKKTLLLGIACIGIAALVFIDRWQVTHWRAEKAIELRATARLCQNRLENAIVSRFNAVEALASLFALRPETKPEEFADFAAMLLKFNPPIRALQYADSKTRVTYVYPPKGNEITISKSMVLLTDPKRGPFVKKAIAQKSASVQGPFELRQGGKGLVVRSPIFLAERFIGLAIGVYDVPVLVKEAIAGINTNQFDFRLSDGVGRIFFGPDNISGDFQEKSISVGDTEWTIALSQIAGSTHPPVLIRMLIWFCGGGFLLSALLLIHFSLVQTRRLELLVKERAKELIKANKTLVDEVTERKQAEEELEKHREHLEELVKERTSELKEKNAELERMNEVFVGREFRIKELKKEIKRLKG